MLDFKRVMLRSKEKPEKKFASPAEELEELRKRYEAKKAELEKAKETKETIEFSKIAAETLKEHAQKKPEKVLKPEYKIPEKIKESLVTKILDLPPESHDKRIEELLGIAEEKGILNAISIVRKLKNPHLEDDFHRALAQVYLSSHLDFKFKKPLSHALGMVLFEVTFPQEEIKDNTKTFKDFISAMKQFYSGMTVLQEDPGAAPYFVLELGLPTIGEEIVFYIAVSRRRKQLLEKQINALFPNAKLEEKKGDYNIFKSEGIGAGAIASLDNHPVLPIKTYDKFDIDPLLVIINAFSKLQKMGEGAALQIIVAPTKEDFNQKIKLVAEEVRKGESFSEALKKHTKGFMSDIIGAFGDVIFSRKDNKDKERSIPAVDENLVKILDEKSSDTILSTNIRILVSAENSDKAYEILTELQSAFSQFTYTHGNALKFKELEGKKLEDLFYNFSFRIFEPKETLYLNTAELSTIFHFPVGIVSISQLKYLKSKEAATPLNLPESGLLLGKNAYRGKETDIYMADDDRRRHIYIIGQTGTGKSVLIKNMIVQDIEKGKGVCFIDPHGSDLQDILARIPKERLDDVIYFNPGETSRPMGLNMLEYDPAYPDQKTFIVNELLGIFNKLFDMKTAGGPMFEQYFRNATMLVMEDPQSGNTLLEVSRVLSDKNLREYKLSQCQNPVIKSFWKEVAEKAGGEAALQNIVPYITSKFDIFLANEIMRPIITQEKSAFNFRKVMDEGKILLINLSKGRLGDINSNLIGLIIVGKLLMASLSRVDVPEEQRKDFYLYIDEFQNITTDSITTILSEARKYRLNLIIAHQFIGQLEENIKKAVFGNVGSMISFRIGAEDAEFLEKQFEPVFNANDLMNIGNYNAYLRVLIEGHSSRPFNMRTLGFQKGDMSITEEVIKLSSSKYGRPREEVEAEINKRYNL